MDETLTPNTQPEESGVSIEKMGDFLVTTEDERATISLMLEVSKDSPGELNQITNNILGDPTISQLVFDLSHTQHIDSVVMRSLVLAAQRASGLREKGADKRVILLDMQPPIREILQKAGLLEQSDKNKIFDIEDTPR